jgi:hypothetical protein
MADQFSALELLLEDGSLDDATKRKAMGAQLRRQNAMGIVGQLMGTQPTQMAGQNLQGGAENSLKLAMQQRTAAKEASARASERQQAQANWQAQMERDQARDAEQRRQFQQQEGRLAAGQNNEMKRRWVAATNPITGESDLFDAYTGEWKSGGAGGNAGALDQQMTDAGITGAAGLPGKTTESQATGARRAGEGTIALNNAISAGFPDESFIGGGAQQLMGVANRAGFPQLASEKVQQQSAFWSNVADPIVRARTGAAMPIEEFRNQMSMLIPRPGESPDTQMKKAQQLVAFMKSGTVGLPPQIRNSLLQQLAYIEGTLPYDQDSWRQMRSGVRSQTAAPQAGPVQQPASGRNFEAEYGLGGN